MFLKVSKTAPWLLAKTSPEILAKAKDYPAVKKLADGTYAVGDYMVVVLGYPQDLYLNCSCPFWQWSGPEYWAYKQNYLYGRPRGTAAKPQVRDPDKSHRMCKHVVAVLRVLMVPPPKPTKQRKGA